MGELKMVHEDASRLHTYWWFKRNFKGIGRESYGLLEGVKGTSQPEISKSFPTMCGIPVSIFPSSTSGVQGIGWMIWNSFKEVQRLTSEIYKPAKLRTQSTALDNFAEACPWDFFLDVLSDDGWKLGLQEEIQMEELKIVFQDNISYNL